LLATASLVFLLMARLSHQGPMAWRVAALGTAAGCSYCLDLGAGPPLLAAVGVWSLYRLPKRGVALFVLAALPWLALHHGLNYAIAGTWRPANAVPENLSWPGSPFDATTMTGRWNHPDVWHFGLYAAALLVGQKGYLLHNLVLLPAVFGLAVLLRRRLHETPELLTAAGWATATWLLYAVTSTNKSGLCCSVRWFVPLAAAGGLVLAVLLRELPRWRPDFVVLAGGGAVVGAVAARYGAWMQDLLPGRWYIVGLTLPAWGVVAWRSRRIPTAAPKAAQPPRQAA
jgi:hypothetical protein